MADATRVLYKSSWAKNFRRLQKGFGRYKVSEDYKFSRRNFGCHQWMNQAVSYGSKQQMKNEQKKKAETKKNRKVRKKNLN